MMFNPDSTRSLVVYTPNAVNKFQNIYVEHLYEIDTDKNLSVYQRDEASGEEKLVAIFRTWEYFRIE